MTDCIVVCRDCDKTKTWRWLCEICAEDCADQHRRQTGHTSLELNITTGRR